jgi:phospholipid/cholesterol/gamma-HCH transport system substrate-binding protein
MMSMPQTVKVGIFMSAALVALAWLILRVEDWHPFAPHGKRIDAVFQSVVGLDDKAAVRVAGVRVGRVDGIALQGRKARVTLLLEKPVTLTEGAEAVVANQGLLGDKFIELYPGAEGAPPLAEGAVLPGRTPISFDQAMEKLGEIGDTIQKTLSGGEGGAAGGVNSLISSLQQTSDELRALIAENRASLNGTVRNFEKFSGTLADEIPKVSRDLQAVLERVGGVIDENRSALHDSMANIKDVTASVQRSVENLNEITDKIAHGEGTIGKLVNSDQAHDELIGALDSVKKGVDSLSDTLGRVQKLKLDLDMSGYYLSDVDDYRSQVRADILPRGDESPHFYRVALVSDPNGRVEHRLDTFTITRPDGSVETTSVDRLSNQYTNHSVSALFGFPFWDRRGKLFAGLIENTGGVEVDYDVVPKRVALSFAAYDFSRQLNLDPHLRLDAKWYPWRNLYVQAGYDDPLVKDYRSPFVGVGIRWSDDDLKYLLGSVPKF